MRHWVMRMTVHLIPAEDYGWLAPLFAERILLGRTRRLAALGRRRLRSASGRSARRGEALGDAAR